MGEIPAAAEAELARLRAENARLLKLLRLTPQQAAPPGPAQASFFEAAPGIVQHRSPEDAKVAFFAALFAARTDVYAVRYDNAHTGKFIDVLLVDQQLQALFIYHLPIPLTTIRTLCLSGRPIGGASEAASCASLRVGLGRSTRLDGWVG